MMINSLPYWPLVEALEALNEDLGHLVRSAGLPTVIERKNTFDLTYSFLRGDFKGGTFHERSYEIHVGDDGKMTESLLLFEAEWVEHECVGNAATPFYYSYHRIADELREARSQGWLFCRTPERHRHITLFVKETTDLFDYPSGYVEALEALW